MSPPTDRAKWLAVYVLCTGMLMIVLDVTIVNVALPNIQDELGFTNASLAWVVNAYLIAFGGLLLLAGRLGDLVGRRRIFLSGLSLFTVASVLCGTAQSQTLLIAARFLQGVGGALTSAVILGMIMTMFSSPRDQAKALGIYAFVASAGGSIGLLAGGVLTESINWHWIFFVNIPIGLATALAGARLLPADKGLGLRAGSDAPGAILVTGALMLAVYTIVEPAAHIGWGADRTLAFGALSVALLIGFVIRERFARQPLIPLRIFRSRALTGANLIQALSTSAMFGMFFLGSLYLQRVRHYDALEIGLAFLPTTLAMGLTSIRYSERLVTRFGVRTTTIAGLSFVGAGLALFAQAPANGNFVAHVLPVMLLVGVGAGTCFPALMNAGMSGAKPEEAGLASGLLNTTAQIGAALGLAVLATLSAARSDHLSKDGIAEAQALTSGYHLAFAIGAGLIAASIAVAATMLKPPAESAAKVKAATAVADEPELART